MYHVVLIDDERIIVEGLTKVVDWSAYHCRVVATAGNAADGAREIRAFYRVGVVITKVG